MKTCPILKPVILLLVSWLPKEPGYQQTKIFLSLERVKWQSLHLILSLFGTILVNHYKEILQVLFCKMPIRKICSACQWEIVYIWVRSWRCGCFVTWFCYLLIAKPSNKTAAPSWPDPYDNRPIATSGFHTCSRLALVFSSCVCFWCCTACFDICSIGYMSS